MLDLSHWLHGKGSSAAKNWSSENQFNMLRHIWETFLSKIPKSWEKLISTSFQLPRRRMRTAQLRLWSAGLAGPRAPTTRTRVWRTTWRQRRAMATTGAASPRRRGARWSRAATSRSWSPLWLPCRWFSFSSWQHVVQCYTTIINNCNCKLRYLLKPTLFQKPAPTQNPAPPPCAPLVAALPKVKSSIATNFESYSLWPSQRWTLLGGPWLRFATSSRSCRAAATTWRTSWCKRLTGKPLCSSRPTTSCLPWASSLDPPSRSVNR